MAELPDTSPHTIEPDIRIPRYTVLSAADGAEALRAVAESTPDAMVLLRQEDIARPVPRDQITVGPLLVDFPGYRALWEGTDLALTVREFQVLSVLARGCGTVITRKQLMAQVWGYEFVADTNIVDVFVCYLRRKLESDGRPRVLHTMRGIGFVLRAPE